MTGQGQSESGAMLGASLYQASRWALLLAGTLLLIGAMRAAAVVVLPLILGGVLALLLAPLVRWLDRYMWRWVAALLALLAPVACVALTAAFWWYAGQQVMARTGAFSLEEAVERLFEARQWAVDRGAPAELLPGPEAEADADGRPQQGGPPPLWDPAALLERLLAAAAGGLGATAHLAAATGLALALCGFALWEAPRWRRWVEAWPHTSRAAYTLSVVDRWGTLVQRYLLAKAINGAAGGLATWLWLLALDVPLAFVWGGLTFLLNFIPGVGVLLSAIPPVVLAVTQLGLGHAMLVAAGLVVIETVTAQVLEPLLQAGLLELSPFLVVASVLFWGWMWGAAGAVLAPILTAGALIAVEHIHVRAGAARPRAP